METDQLVEEYQTRALQVESSVIERDIKDIGQLATDEINRLDTFDISNPVFMKTGYYDIDNILTLEEKFLLVIGGFPSGCKTVFGLNIMLNARKLLNVGGVLFSIDNSDRQIRRRFMAMNGGPELNKLLKDRIRRTDILGMKGETLRILFPATSPNNKGLVLEKIKEVFMEVDFYEI